MEKNPYIELAECLLPEEMIEYFEVVKVDKTKETRVSGFSRWVVRCQEYNVASLNMKNLMSLTPLNWVRNAFIFALNDSAEAFVSLSWK